MMIPKETMDKIEWMGECEGDGGNTFANVIWKQPDDLDWSEGYSANATNADCDAMEDYFEEAFPDSLYTAHSGYAPEERWTENAVDTKLQKQAWYGKAS